MSGSIHIERVICIVQREIFSLTYKIQIASSEHEMILGNVFCRACIHKPIAFSILLDREQYLRTKVPSILFSANALFRILTFMVLTFF